MSNGGKGSKPRPFSVKLQEYDKNWDAIFGKKEPNGEIAVEKKPEPTYNKEDEPK